MNSYCGIRVIFASIFAAIGHLVNEKTCIQRNEMCLDLKSGPLRSASHSSTLDLCAAAGATFKFCRTLVGVVVSEVGEMAAHRVLNFKTATMKDIWIHFCLAHRLTSNINPASDATFREGDDGSSLCAPTLQTSSH